MSDFEAETTEEYERRQRRERRQGARRSKHAARFRARYKQRLQAALADQREHGGGRLIGRSDIELVVERAIKRERKKLAKTEVRTFYVGYSLGRKSQYSGTKAFVEGAGTAIDVFGRGKTTEALRGYVGDGAVVVNNRALARDWEAVGFDVAQGARKFIITVESEAEGEPDDAFDVFSKHYHSI
jgi:hypothetical protein